MTPYEILGVETTATPEEVKSAYRKLAMKHHPDRGGSTEEFHKIQQAYEDITNPKPQHQNSNFDPFGFQGWSPFANWEAPPQRNSSYAFQALITLDQAYSGHELSITLDDRIITIRVPKGAYHGQRLVVKGEGGREFPNLPAGDIYVTLIFDQHPVFQASGADLYMEYTVNALDIMIGTEIEVVTISGEKILVSVPKGSKPTTRLRVPKKGMPILGTNDFADLYIIMIPLFPELNDEQIKLLKDAKT